MRSTLDGSRRETLGSRENPLRGEYLKLLKNSLPRSSVGVPYIVHALHRGAEFAVRFFMWHFSWEGCLHGWSLVKRCWIGLTQALI